MRVRADINAAAAATSARAKAKAKPTKPSIKKPRASRKRAAVTTPEGACEPEWCAQRRQHRTRGDTEWRRDVAGAEHPSWAKHFIKLLRDPLLKLKIRHGDSIRLVMWSDCAGKCTEKCAANEIAVQLKEELSLNIEF